MAAAERIKVGQMVRELVKSSTALDYNTDEEFAVVVSKLHMKICSLGDNIGK